MGGVTHVTEVLVTRFAKRYGVLPFVTFFALRDGAIGLRATSGSYTFFNREVAYHVLVAVVRFHLLHICRWQYLYVLTQRTWHFLSAVSCQRIGIDGPFGDVVGKALLAERVETEQRLGFLEKLIADGASQLFLELCQSCFRNSCFRRGHLELQPVHKQESPGHETVIK